MSISAGDSLSRRARPLWRLPNVVAIGVGYRERGGTTTGEVAVTVAVTRKVCPSTLPTSDRVPYRVGDLRTDVIEVGELRAQAARPAPSDGRGQMPNGVAIPKTALPANAQRDRMLRPGLSIGHPDGASGTLGPLVERDGRWYWLSCNHVMALANRAQIGDLILQPGPRDGGTAADAIAHLVEYVPLRWLPASQLASLWARLFGIPVNDVDAALAYPVAGTVGLSLPAGTRDPQSGEYVSMTGRTSGETAGRIRAVSVALHLDYDGRMALFRGQVLATGMTAAGDSGAAVIDESGRLAGMVIGGSDKATVITPIGQIGRALDVRPVCKRKGN